ncbi:MAG TPA: DNA polymerase IV, partial [Candidatus Polarisedimenticolia bacterium]
MGRSVLHIDIAVFPIAVERVVDPGLRGRPVVVAPPGSARAPVLAASVEAAREG